MGVRNEKVGTLPIQRKERVLYLLQEILARHQVSETLVIEALLDYLEHTDNLELYVELWEVLHVRGLCDYWS